MTEYAVELRNASKAYSARQGEYEGVQAITNINLSIPQGEFFTLLGPSGCGKTTTLRIVGGFEIPTSGEVFIQGKDMTNVPPNRRPVNTVFQNYALFPHMNITQNVAFGLKLKRVPKEEREKQVAEALQLVRMSGLEHRRPSELSGGQQQRVALARALVNKPAVLLLDEPLGALDLKLRKAMQLELKHLQSEVGITFIYVTHDQEEALTMSDRIAVMSQGQVLQVGDPLTIYEKPDNKFVADFIGETNFLQGKVISIGEKLHQVQIADTIVTALPSEKTLKVDDQVTLAVRPEKLILSPDKTSSAAIMGKVAEIVYIGTDTRYVVSLPDGQAVVGRVGNIHSQAQQKFQLNQQVFINWMEQDARLLAS